MTTRTRELLILRHAKSAWDTDARTDFDRPLARRGERDAPRIGAWLHDHGLTPDLVVSSPARRAERTTRLVVDELGLADDAIRFDDDLYGAATDDLLAALAAHAAHAPRCVMLVGHNPGLTALVEYLLGDDLPVDAGEKPFPTAALARLALPGDWSDLERGAGQLLALVRPRSLAS